MSRAPAALAFVFTMMCLGCGGQEAPPKDANDRSREEAIRRAGDDRGQCEYEGRKDRETIESRGPGASTPNVRRVFGLIGKGDEQRRVLLCREIDTNLDGLKDVLRRYNERSEAIEEVADTDYDGAVDTWIRFTHGRIAKVEVDSDANGKVDETRYYVRGALSRVQRDTNRDGKPDIWEIYAGGRLDRMGVDLDRDGHVDRWDRDEVARRTADLRAREEAERLEREEAAKAEARADAGAPKRDKGTKLK